MATEVAAWVSIADDDNLFVPVPNHKQSLEDIGQAITISSSTSTSSSDVVPTLSSRTRDLEQNTVFWIPDRFQLDGRLEARRGKPKTAFADENVETVQSPYGTQQATFTAIWRNSTCMAARYYHWSTARQCGGPLSACPEYSISLW